MENCRMLLLDNVQEDREIVKLLSKRFQKLKVEITEASSEEDLLKIYAVDKKFDCIVLNTSMNDKKVSNLLKVIQKYSDHKKMAIVGLLEEMCVSKTTKFSELGVWKFLLKEYINSSNLEFVILTAMNLQKLQDNLEYKNLELQVSNKKLKDLVTIVAHDLRTPMANLISYFEIFEDLGEKEKARAIYHIKNTSNRMMNLIDNVLDLNKIEKSFFDVYCESVNPKDMIEALLFEVEFAAKEKNINLNIVMPKEDLICFCDKDRIHQVLSNLLMNAIKFSHKDSEIKFGIKKKENKLEFFVKDDGIGIDQNKIFSLLENPENFTSLGTLGERGNGIGLSLCQQILKLHESTLELISEKKSR